MEVRELQEKCGLFGCVAADQWPTKLEISSIISLGLDGLQHRGQESSGIVISSGNDPIEPLKHHRGMGLVSQVFNPDVLQRLKGNLGIGHTRYSTMGTSERTNCQPFIVETTYGQFSVAHNGELVNSQDLKRKILLKGIGLSTGSDSEVITQLLCSTPECGEPENINWVSRIKNLMKETFISYCLLILFNDRIYAVRDPFGNRPLVLGKVKNLSSKPESKEQRPYLGYVASSESCVFNSTGCKFMREVVPGEIVEISRDGCRSMGIIPRPEGASSALCIFEYVYFARPDSYMEGQQVYSVRFRQGQELARESPVEADIVSTIPESATPAALGFAKESGLPYCEVLSRNRYVGRTFIQPSTHLRQLGVAKKFGVLEGNFRGKRVILVDDSIVRGTTVEPIVKMLKRFGATEVHMRIASPQIKHPCYMGINIPTRNELIANSMTSDELAAHVGADSLVHLSIEGLHRAVNQGIENREVLNVGHCNACLTGQYPIEPVLDL